MHTDISYAYILKATNITTKYLDIKDMTGITTSKNDESNKESYLGDSLHDLDIRSLLNESD